ncbi:MAG: permease prefix domain 1-containing protein [Phycisphaerales bacterium]
MTTKPKQRTPVEPSARDPIASWLDVFVGLLQLPKDQKRTIRDELEDHLRSRVDDLLITGISESEATREAVAELGETAELAKSFRAASRTSHTRRLIMTASICTILGAVLGLSTITGTALNANHTTNSAMLSTQPETVAVRDRTFGELFEDLKSHTDTPVLIHWDRLEDAGIEPDEPVNLDVAPLAPHRVYALLRERTEYEHGDPIAVIESDDLVEITTRSHEDARTTTLRTHDIRDLLQTRTGMTPEELIDGSASGSRWRAEAEGIFETIVELVETDSWVIMGGDRARGQLAGASLLIEAPQRIHERVEEVLAMFRADAEESRALARAAADRSIAENERRLADARAALDAAATEYAHLKARCDRLQREHQLMVPRFRGGGAVNPDTPNEQHDPAAAEAIQMELTRLEVDRDLAEGRVRQLTDRVLNLEFMASQQPTRTGHESGRDSEARADTHLRRLESINRLEAQGRIDADRAATMRQRAQEQLDRPNAAR